MNKTSDLTDSIAAAAVVVDDAIAESRNHPYQLFMLVLCVYVLFALMAETFFPLSPEIVTILETVDTAICFVFLADFFGNLVFRTDRLAYLRWGWLDLVSSIPALDVLRWGRLARIIRIMRVLRAVRSTRLLATYILRRRAESTVLAVSLISILLVVFASIAILQVERHNPEANIQTPEHALWWAFVTITTVGYGDKFPVTTEGRIVAAVLMTGGVGLFGTFTGFVASWFLAPGEKQRESEIDGLRRDIAELRDALRQRLADRPTQIPT